MFTFKVNDTIYDLPEDKVADFKATYPDAVEITDEIQTDPTEGKTSDVAVVDAAFLDQRDRVVRHAVHLAGALGFLRVLLVEQRAAALDAEGDHRSRALRQQPCRGAGRCPRARRSYGDGAFRQSRCRSPRHPGMCHRLWRALQIVFRRPRRRSR